MIEFSCPHCGSRHATNERYLGQKIRCGTCHLLFTIALPDDRYSAHPKMGLLPGMSGRKRVLALVCIGALLAGTIMAGYYLGAHKGDSRLSPRAVIDRSTRDLVAAFPAISRAPISTLQDAIASGLVVADFSGNGGSSGDSVRVQVSKGSKSSPGTLEEVLPVGSVLMSRDEGAQSMMISSVRGVDLGGGKYRPESRIVLSDGEAVTYVLRAYCIQFEKENPSNSTRFSLGRPDPNLACIARRGTRLTVPAMQAAVWMQSDKITYAHMAQKFPISEEDWSAGQAVFQECQSPAQAGSQGPN